MAVTTEQRSTVVGVFEDRRHADNAVSELRQTGFREDQIGVAGRHAEGETPEATTAEPGTHWETGAATGALAGAGLGGLVGLGILAGIIPAIGPVIAGGTLAAILANAAGGAALGGLVGALVGAGLPEEEARYYQSELEAGRTLVTVKADGRSDEAASILHRHGAYDMHTAPGAATAAPASRTAEGGARIQVREEELQAHKQPVETGEVRVRKEAVTEHRTMEVPVQREEVVIERQAPTGEPTSASDIGPGEEIRVPVSAEQVTVEKQPVVKEEVTVGKRAVQDTERVGGEVRKEQVRVEREGDVDVRGSGPGKK
jgi:uncharacterized protein (TIGR02271 family)